MQDLTPRVYEVLLEVGATTAFALDAERKCLVSADNEESRMTTVCFVEEWRADLTVVVVDEWRAELKVSVVDEWLADLKVAQVEEWRADKKIAIVEAWRADGGGGGYSKGPGTATSCLAYLVCVVGFPIGAIVLGFPGGFVLDFIVWFVLLVVMYEVVGDL